MNVIGYCFAPPSIFSTNHNAIAVTHIQKQIEKMTEQKTRRWEKQLCSCASISILGVQIFVGGAKPPAAPLGDVIGAINPLKHLAPLVPSVLFCNRFQVVSSKLI